MATVAPDQTPGRSAQDYVPLSQLLPFNEGRFDAALALLAEQYARPLTKYEMIKLHVLMDVEHTLGQAMPIIGGRLAPWPNGPVVVQAYERLDDWCTRYEMTGESPEGFEIEAMGKLRRFRPLIRPERDDFSGSELAAMQKAWDFLIPLMDQGYAGYQQSQHFFHDPATPIGRAYQRAKAAERAIDWNDILEAYDDIHGTNHSHIKDLVRPWARPTAPSTAG